MLWVTLNLVISEKPVILKDQGWSIGLGEFSGSDLSGRYPCIRLVQGLHGESGFHIERYELWGHDSM